MSDPHPDSAPTAGIPARLTTALADRYTIERELGEGGMATVYLADDIKHERKVALKVLKPELAAVVGAERFLAEIKTTANLQHPHILPLFDSGQADSFLFYVMPYVEGESLRDRLDREHQLPVDEAVKIATDLADALDYAHRHEVIHRDIKPANILMHEGRPLIADFGIALAVGTAGGGRLTETGLSLGTPYYMSPEQATGEQFVGPATDTYALGVMLYEMLVGDPPYTGSSAQAVLGQIIAGDSVTTTTKRPSVPANVDAALRCALEKLPADRFARGEDMVRALADPAFRHGRSDALSDSVGAFRRRAVSGALVVALGLAAWGWLRPTESLPVVRLPLSISGGGQKFAISPDGDRLAYVGSLEANGRRIWHRELRVLNPSPIPGSDGASYLSFSPEGRRIAFVNALGELSVASFEGESSVKIGEVGRTGSGMSWGPDGSIYTEGTSGIDRADASGGTPLEAVTNFLPDETRHLYPHALPNGRGMLFVATHGGDASENSIEVLDLATGQHEFLVLGVRAVYAATGHLVYVTSDGALAAVSFDQSRLLVTGPPTILHDGVMVAQYGTVGISMSSAGHLLYSTSGGTSGLAEPTWVARDGTAEPVESDWVGEFRTVSLSPNGTRLAVSIVDRGEEHVWIKTLGGGPLQRLSDSDGLNWRPAWRPDGTAVGYISDRSGTLNAYVKRSDGAGPESELVPGGRGVEEVLWSRDGEWVVFRQGGGLSGGTRDVFRVRVGSDSGPEPFLATEAEERVASLSPDGRWVAFLSNQSGSEQVFVRRFPVGDEQWVVSSQGAVEPLWSPAGDEIFYRSSDRQMMAVSVQADSTFRVLEERALFPSGEYRREANYRAYDVTADGQSFVMIRTNDQIGEVVWVQNFFELLKERVGN